MREIFVFRKRCILFTHNTMVVIIKYKQSLCISTAYNGADGE